MVQIREIDLTTVVNLEKTITDVCTVLNAAGNKLVSTFVYGNRLVMIFQN